MSSFPSTTDPGAPPVRTAGFSTSEFTATMTALATAVISVLAMLWKWTPEMVQTWTGIVTTSIGALAILIANVMAGVVAWKYSQARSAVKVALVGRHYEYAAHQNTAGQPVRQITV
jgi:hypothetical protein